MLDPHGRAQVMKTIRQLRAAGITIVSITHYMEEAAQADRVLVMSRGRIVMEGTPEQVFSQTERLHGYHLDVRRPPSCATTSWSRPGSRCRKMSLPPTPARRSCLSC